MTLYYDDVMCNKPCRKDVAYPNHVNYNTVRICMIYQICDAPNNWARLLVHEISSQKMRYKRKVEWKLFFFLRIVLDLIKGCSSISISYLVDIIILYISMIIFRSSCATKLLLKIIAIFTQGRYIISRRLYISLLKWMYNTRNINRALYR